MLPIHKLLSQLRWDPRYRSGRYVLGYYDRVVRRVLHVPFALIRFPTDAPREFDLWDEYGAHHRIPFHRVRQVFRDRRLLWERHPPGEGTARN